MDIRNISSNKELSKNNPGKTNKLSKSDQSSPVSSTGVKKSNAAKSKGDSVNLSGLKFASEIDFARTTLDKLKAENLSSLKKVKQKIDQGAYTNDKVHDQISTIVKDDLTSLSILLDENSTGNSSENISAEQKDFLLNNNKVLEEITSKIFNDLNKI